MKSCAGLEEEKDGIRQTTKSKQSDLEEVHWPEVKVFRRPNNTTYTPLKIEIKISSTKA